MFSVLMSLYYKERPLFLCASLDSIFTQTLIPDEVILVEDGPLSDELYSVLDEYEKKYPQLKRVKLLQNGGLGKALNEGLKHCSYELVARMDTDDIAVHDRFEKQVKYMSEHPEVDISSGWLIEFCDSIENRLSLKKVPETHDQICEYIKYRNPLNHPAVILKKSVVENAGGYQHFPLFEDWYLWARMLKEGAFFANIQEPLVYFRTSPEMYKRRGGIRYAINSAKFQWQLHKLGIISILAAIKASIVRGSVYLMPNYIRKAIYSKFLRS